MAIARTLAVAHGGTELLRDLNTFDLLFVSLVVRDLRVYADAADAAV